MRCRKIMSIEQNENQTMETFKQLPNVSRRKALGKLIAVGCKNCTGSLAGIRKDFAPSDKQSIL